MGTFTFITTPRNSIVLRAREVARRSRKKFAIDQSPREAGVEMKVDSVPAARNPVFPATIRDVYFLLYRHKSRRTDNETKPTMDAVRDFEVGLYFVRIRVMPLSRRPLHADDVSQT
ncbi:hypothetical protein EVAR_22752_1 [Eumeta japonica]|uniref:Uncharacterized protein n=1 Tax=Eumeta variegata TaxID=151549 RepID=A0A4C1UT22_EUMVA|nr:hypothetical protein EVAR_22752_1 [Eumeta japonica]